MTTQTVSVRLDCELARLAIAFRDFNVYRVWAYAHSLGTGAGWIQKDCLYEHLLEMGVIGSRRTFNNILQKGHGIYWTIGLGRAADGSEKPRVYLTGYVSVSKKLVGRALVENPALVATNRPGRQKVFIDLTGSLRDAQSRVYSAWHSLNTKPDGHNVISRQKLNELWGRATPTLLGYEESAGIAIEPQYAKHPDPTSALVPKHAFLCADNEGGKYASWRMPNKYIAPAAESHAHAGNRRKARKAANAIVETSAPVFDIGDGMQKTGRLYFRDRETARGFQPGYKALDRHLRRHGDLDRRHYALLGTLGKHNRVTLWEQCTGDMLTSLNDRDFQAEQSPGFIQDAMRYRLVGLIGSVRDDRNSSLKQKT